MNAADLARLEWAKRVYKAAQATENEIQTGVRRARLSLSRPKPRRAWFSKGLVFVALAIGSLAYAKPHALGELVENVLPRDDAAGAKRGVSAEALRSPKETPARATAHDTHRLAATNTAATTNATAANGTAATNAAAAPSLVATALPVAGAVGEATPVKKIQPFSRSTPRALAVRAEAEAPDAAAAVSDWGRVGQALASGDETQALAALAELSQSDDQRTRDKADIGRAQLLMAHGDRDKACALARSLTNRRAGSRIERQAQTLLKSCAR